MNSDLSNVKVGDWVWTIQSGWEKVKGVSMNLHRPVTMRSGYGYTLNGCLWDSDKFPSAFIVPPSEFNAGDPPCEFQDDEKVMVTGPFYSNWMRRHFAYMKDGHYYCYLHGMDKWVAGGETIAYDQCRKWEEWEEEEG